MENLTITHLKATKRILRYIKDEIYFGLSFSLDKNYKLVGYNDSEWDEDKDDQKSIGSFVLFLENRAYTWIPKKQPLIVTLSTCSYIMCLPCSVT